MKRLVFATHNPNKKREVAQMLKGLYEVIDLNDLGLVDEIPEDGTSLEENAEIKSTFIYKKFGLNCFADDTGLEVDALDGAPGVHTARYAGDTKDAEANMNKLIGALESKTTRTAQFRTAICLILEGHTHHFEGIARGTIRKTRSGQEGFGYDPVFEPDGYDVTFAEMSSDEKNLISHRGKAVSALIGFLKGED